MNFRFIALAIALAVAGAEASAQPMTARDIQDELVEAGYSQVHDINFGAEAVTAKATKDGKEWLLVIDSHGKVLRQQQQ